MDKELYHEVAERINELKVSVVSFPDGSVDTYYRVLDGHKGLIKSKEEMIKRLEEGNSDFKLAAKRKEPGGISVNMASQAHSLGLETMLIGHTDDRVFEKLEFDVKSLGTPAEVTVCEFEDGDMLLAKESQDLMNWSMEELSDKGLMEEITSADVICCANWASIPEMTEELEKLIELDPESDIFNFDPGPLMNIDADRIKELFKVLGQLGRTLDVLVHASTEEMEAVAKAMDITGTEEEKVRKIQEKTGVTAYILHDKPKALAGTSNGFYRVENVVTEKQSTFSGAGDRFSSAVGIAKASGWNWEHALALGNICAVNYIEENSTADKKAVKSQIQSKLL